VHDGLEMRNDYFSMSAVRATHDTTLSLEVARVCIPLGNGKVRVLEEQVRLARYITTQAGD